MILSLNYEDSDIDIIECSKKINEVQTHCEHCIYDKNTKKFLDKFTDEYKMSVLKKIKFYIQNAEKITIDNENHDDWGTFISVLTCSKFNNIFLSIFVEECKIKIETKEECIDLIINELSKLLVPYDANKKSEIENGKFNIFKYDEDWKCEHKLTISEAILNLNNSESIIIDLDTFSIKYMVSKNGNIFEIQSTSYEKSFNLDRQLIVKNVLNLDYIPEVIFNLLSQE